MLRGNQTSRPRLNEEVKLFPIVLETLTTFLYV